MEQLHRWRGGGTKEAHGYFFAKNLNTGKFDLTHRSRPLGAGQGQEEVRIYRNCTAVSVSSDSAEVVRSVLLITTEFCDKVLLTGTDVLHRFPARYGWVIDDINTVLDSRITTPVQSIRQGPVLSTLPPLTNRVYPVLSVLSDMSGNPPSVALYETDDEGEEEGWVGGPKQPQVAVAVAAIACTEDRLAEWRRLSMLEIDTDALAGGGSGGSGSCSGCGGGSGDGRSSGCGGNGWILDETTWEGRVVHASQSDYAESLVVVRGRASVITL